MAIPRYTKPSGDFPQRSHLPLWATEVVSLIVGQSSRGPWPLLASPQVAPLVWTAHSGFLLHSTANTTLAPHSAHVYMAPP